MTTLRPRVQLCWFLLTASTPSAALIPLTISTASVRSTASSLSIAPFHRPVASTTGHVSGQDIGHLPGPITLKMSALYQIPGILSITCERQINSPCRGAIPPVRIVSAHIPRTFGKRVAESVQCSAGSTTTRSCADSTWTNGTPIITTRRRPHCNLWPQTRRCTGGSLCVDHRVSSARAHSGHPLRPVSA